MPNGALEFPLAGRAEKRKMIPMSKKNWAWLLLSPLFLIFPLSQSCGGEKVQPPWSLSYSDGSGNSLRFAQDREDGSAEFEYLPVRPENSSTGIYSGGEPRQGRLDAKQVKELQKHLGKLESDASLRVEDRDKGTGAFTVREGDKSRSFILKNSPALSEFNDFLLKNGWRSAPKMKQPG